LEDAIAKRLQPEFVVTQNSQFVGGSLVMSNIFTNDKLDKSEDRKEDGILQL